MSIVKIFNKDFVFNISYRKLIILILPLLIVVLRGWDGFAYPSESLPYSDLTLSHYMLIEYIRQQLFDHHVFPLWFPTILSGMPLYANPLAGLWYPFGWPALVLPLPFGFNLLVGLHLAWGSLGMYLLLRKQGVSTIPSIFGSLAFGLMPKVFAHYGAGHLTLMYAVPWTPWLLLTIPPGKYSNRMLPAIVLALILLADVRWAAYAGLLWSFWVVVQPFSRTDSSEVNDKLFRESLLGILNKFGYVIGLVAFTFLLTAALTIPLMEYISMSTRVNMQVDEIFSHSLSLPGLLGLFYPPLKGGAHETTLYFGGITLLLGLMSLLQFKMNRYVTFWLGVFLGALVFSLGSNLLLLKPLASVPLLSLLRVPSRALFIGGIALATLAAISLDCLDGVKNNNSERTYKLLIFAITISIFLLGIILALIVPLENKLSYLWGAFAILTSFLWIWVYLVDKIRQNIFLFGLFAILILDIGLAGQSMIGYRSKQTVFSENSQVAEYLSNDQTQFRSYAPGFSVLQHEASFYGLEIAEGVDPLHLRNYVDYLNTASGLSSHGYSVTVPAFFSAEELNDRFDPDPSALGQLNIKYILVDFDLRPIEGLIKVGRIGSTRIYENLNVMPRAWVYKSGQNDADLIRLVEDFKWSSNHIELTAEGPGRLVLSEIDYPGWEAMVDGDEVDIQSEKGILRSLDLPYGVHQINFILRPLSLYIGVLMSCITWVGLLTYFVLRKISIA